MSLRTNDDNEVAAEPRPARHRQRMLYVVHIPGSSPPSPAMPSARGCGDKVNGCHYLSAKAFEYMFLRVASPR